MNIAIECEVVLSKKLEAICEEGEPISLHVASTSGNKGVAILRLTCKDGIKLGDVAKIGETSLPIRIVSAAEDVQSMAASGRRFANLTGSLPEAAEGIAVVTTPEHPAGQAYVPPPPKQQPPTQRPVEPQQPPQEPPQAAPQPQAAQQPASSPDALRLVLMALQQAGIQIPSSMVATMQNTVSAGGAPNIQQVTRPKIPDNSIRTPEELRAELNSVPGIDDPLRIPMDRKMSPQEAEAFLNRMPRLRRKAYLRNLLPGQFIISDLYTTFDGGGQCIALLPGAAFDLSRIPAKNILNSTDLWFAFETGKADLVDRETYAACFKKVERDIKASEPSTLPVEGGEPRLGPTDSTSGVVEKYAAGAGMTDERESIHIGGLGPDPVAINIGSGSDERPPSVPWEESPEMQVLIGKIPMNRPPPPAKQPRRM